MAYVPDLNWQDNQPPGFAADDMIHMQNGIATADANANQALSGLTQKVDKGTLVVNVKDFGAVGDGVADDTASIQSALNNARAGAGAALIPAGTYRVSGTLAVGSGVTLVGQGATIVQSAPMTPALVIDGEDVVVHGVYIQGRTSDWVNNSTTYNATGIMVSASARNVRIADCHMLGIAGAGINMNAGADDVHITGCTITGPGGSVVPSDSGQYGAGIRSLTSGTWTVQFNDISGFAQGVVTADGQANVRIIGNHIHDIPGQHALYLQGMVGGVVQGNSAWDVAVHCMKIQLGTSGAQDATDITISGNVFIEAGGYGILLTNTKDDQWQLRRVSILGNVIRGAGFDGIGANHCTGLSVLGNMVLQSRGGVAVTDSSTVAIRGNMVDGVTQSGISLNGVDDFTIASNDVLRAGGGGDPGLSNGVHILNGCSDGMVAANRVSDDAGGMRYGFYATGDTPDLTTMSFIDNVVTGATDYGWRFNGTAQDARIFHGNHFSGISGALLNPPTNFAQVADTSEATLPALESEVNALKAALRRAGIVRE